MSTAFTSSAELALEISIPSMWKVLVRRLKVAEARRRIADDWETVAFGSVTNAIDVIDLGKARATRRVLHRAP